MKPNVGFNVVKMLHSNDHSLQVIHDNWQQSIEIADWCSNYR